MKSFVIQILGAYQHYISPLLHQLLGIQTACRFPQSCSAYAKEAITQHGLRKGGTMALKRFFNCQPFSGQFSKKSLTHSKL